MNTADPSPLPLLAAPPPGLASALGRLADDLQQQPVPPLAGRVRQALQRPATPPRRGLRWLAWAGSGAALCALALIGSVLLLLLAPPEGPEAGRQARARSGPPSGFITVASAERWQQVLHEDAMTTAWLVPTEMPRERLAALGLPFDPARAGDRVSAELLMHPSGEVLAVRVLNNP